VFDPMPADTHRSDLHAPSFHLGTVPIAGPAVQAALSGYSDLPMRRVARAHGAPYAVNEVVLDEHVLGGGKLSARALFVPDDDHPVGGQLMGSVPERFGAAAAQLVGAGYDVIDINFGCPVAKVLGRCRGGYLLSDPPTALQIVDRVVDAVQGDRPVTIKMRRGFDDTPEAEAAFFEILDGAFERGISAVTVHGRTVRQKYIGPSRWEFLTRVKQHVGDRTVLGSGDLFDAYAVVRMLRETGVDGVTVARGCIGNPFAFRQIADLIAGAIPQRPTLSEQRQALELHWQHARAVHSPKWAITTTRTHAIKYAALHPHADAARKAMVAIRSAAAIDEAIEAWYCPERYGEGGGPLLPVEPD